jgi:hypothetical protein
MTKPETLKDIIDETMRVSGVPYPVPVREKQFGGDHYKKMGIEPWDIVDTWPLEQQKIGYYRGGALKISLCAWATRTNDYKKHRRVCTTKKN